MKFKHYFSKLVIAALSPLANSTICGVGWWHISFDISANVQIQTMDSFDVNNKQGMNIGGAFTDGTIFDGQSGPGAFITNYNQASDFNQSGNEAYIIQSDMGSAGLQIIGVSAMVFIARDNKDETFGVFQTASDSDEIVIFYLEEKNEFNLYIQRLSGTVSHCLTTPKGISAYEKSQATLVLDPCPGSSVNTIEFFHAKLNDMDDEDDPAIDHRYALERDNPDWSTGAVYIGKKNNPLNSVVDALPNTQFSWVGKGTCDTGDGNGPQMSVIYIATSFVEEFQSYETPGRHMLCSACIGVDITNVLTSFSIVETTGTRMDDSVFFIQGPSAYPGFGNFITTLATYNANRCGDLIKRAIYLDSGEGDLFFMGWKNEGYDSTDTKGTITLKTVNSAGTQYYIVNEYDPYDTTDTGHTLLKVELTQTLSPGLQSMWESSTSFFVNLDLEFSIFAGDSFVLQSISDCGTSECNSFCLSTQIATTTDQIIIDGGPTNAMNAAFPSRDYSTLLLTYRTDSVDYDFYAEIIEEIGENSAISASKLNELSLKNPCEYTLSATINDPVLHSIAFDPASPTNAFTGITVSSSDTCPGTSSSPSSLNHVVLLTDLVDSNGNSVGVTSPILDNYATLITADDASQIDTYTVYYKIGFDGESDAQIMACTFGCDGSYTLEVVENMCVPNFPPDETLNSSIDLFDAAVQLSFTPSSTNGCADTELSYSNLGGSAVFTHSNAAEGSTSSVVIDLLANDEAQEGTHTMYVLETSVADPSIVFQKTITVTVVNTCYGLTLSWESLNDSQITAGAPSITISIPDFQLLPVEAAAICPGITHEYSYSMVSGTIDASWLYLDVWSTRVVFSPPATFNGIPVEYADFNVDVYQRVAFINSPSSQYTGMVSTFNVEMLASEPCTNLQITAEPLTDFEYTTGDALLTLNVQDFELGPANLISQCQGLVHTYSYVLNSGIIEDKTFTLNSQEKIITFEAKTSFEGVPVEAAVINISVEQSVFSTFGALITTATASFSITVDQTPCFDLTFTNQPANYDIDYTAGDSPIIEQLTVLALSPSEIAFECPSITQIYSYSVEEGTIEEDWINFDTNSQILTFQTPATYEESPVNSAVIRVNLTQAVLSDEDYIYASVTQQVLINMEESATGFCVPDFMGLAPSSQAVEMHLGDTPTELIITSKSMNNCSDTSFSIQYSNNTDVDSSIFLFETTESPHQAKVTVLADKLGTFAIEVKEQANVDPSLHAITGYEVQIKHPCEDIGLTAEEFNDQGYTPGSGPLEFDIADFQLNPLEVADICPSITHAYSYSVLCGAIQNDWLVLDATQHKVVIETPETFKYQGREEDVLPAVIRITIVQSVDEQDGKRYTSATTSFSIYLGDRDQGQCFNGTEIEVTGEEYVPPVHLAIHSMSIDGNLTFVFSRPLVIPQVLLDLVIDRRRELSTSDLTLHDFIEIFVMSSIHDVGSDSILIEDYQLTRFTEKEFDIQVIFKKPDQISQIITEPDRLGMRFKETNLFEEATAAFIDQIDMDAGIDLIEVDLVPQISPLDLADIQVTEEQTQKAMSVVSTTNLILNCFLYVGLKYLWNMVNLLQFEVFMLLWQISIPYKAEAFLKYIKLLALMEFIPSAWFTDAVSELLDVQCEEENSTCQDSVDESEKTGLSKLGSTNIVTNMGIMLLVAVFILLFIIVLLLSKRCMYSDYRIYRTYMKIRQRIFWNAFIRYALQSELKLLISACSVLALESSKDLPDKLNMIFPTIMLIFLLLCPLLFLYMMMKYRKELGKPSVRDRIGTLYLGLRPERDYVVSYSMVFILRRVIFVIITFALFDQPGIQIQVFIYTSLLYIIYISHMYFHDPRWSKDLEVVNESIFLLVCYHIVVLVNLLWDVEVRDLVGKSLVWTTSAILIMNMSLILVVSVKAGFRKWQLMRAKKMMKQQMVARMYEIAEADRIQKKEHKKTEMEKLQDFHMSVSLPAQDQSLNLLHTQKSEPNSSSKLNAKQRNTCRPVSKSLPGPDTKHNSNLLPPTRGPQQLNPDEITRLRLLGPLSLIKYQQQSKAQQRS